MVTGNPGSSRRNKTRPLVIIAAVAGILVIVITGLLVFWGGTGSGGPFSGTDAATEPGRGGDSAARAPQGPDGVMVYGVTPVSVFELVPVQVPADGIYIRTSYIGGYDGSYTTGDKTKDIGNSGERLVEVTDPGPAVSVSIKKLDGSADHILTVELWKDGRLVNTATTDLPFGQVNISRDIQV